MAFLASCGKADNKGGDAAENNGGANTAGAPDTGGGTAQGSPSSSAPALNSPPAAPTAAAPSGDNVKYADKVDIIIDNTRIATLNLYNVASNNSPTNWVFSMIYDKLLISYEPGKYEPMLATSWETDDWQTITMHLREDATFHNGDHFTADDVYYTVMASRDAVGTPAFDRWGDVETVTILDQYTIQFVLKRVNVDWFYNLSQPASGIINERAIAADPESGAQIGTGAYKVKEFATNDYVLLERNDNYWGAPPITKEVTLRFVPEPSARLMMLQNGQSDACFSLDPVDMELIEADTEHFVAYPYVMNNMNGIGFNMDDPICGDWNFRMAVASAIDRDEITLAACGIYGIPESTGTMYGFQNEFRNDSIPIIPYDIDAAKAYLAASPYKGETIEIATAIITNIIAAEVLQQQLSKIGINTSINQMDPPSMGAYLRYGDNKSQMFVYVIPQNSLSAAAYRNLVYPGASHNRTSYYNQEIIDMLDLATTVADRTERGNMYTKMQEIYAEDPSMINLFWLGQVAGCAKGVGGMHLPSDFFFDLRYVYKVIE
jgi:peptide/nickel transport system substrate-binding protein